MIQKVAIVTGAAKGIGYAIAKRFLRENYFVVIADVDEKQGRATAVELDGSSKFIPCDICKERDVKKLFNEVMKKFKQVDVVVNNAGFIRDNLIWKMPAEDFDAVIRVHLYGTWLMCRETANMMRAQNHGRIVNISSRAWLGNPGQTNYSAAKAGIIGLTRALALELSRYNVNVNVVAPGLIDTPLTQKLSREVKQKLIDAQPTKKMGKPEDVADVVFFLASPRADFITGQIIYVDGGKSIGSNLL